MSSALWFVVVLSCVGAFYLLRKSLFRAVIGKPNFPIPALAHLLAEGEEFTFIRSSVEGVPRVQILSSHCSILYTKSVHAETVNVHVPGYAGLVFTWKGGKVIRLTRIGGRDFINPELPVPEKEAIHACLARVREIVL